MWNTGEGDGGDFFLYISHVFSKHLLFFGFEKRRRIWGGEREGGGGIGGDVMCRESEGGGLVGMLNNRYIYTPGV